MEVTQETADSLASKLAGLDLTASERAALDSVFLAAHEPETMGFGHDSIGMYSMTIMNVDILGAGQDAMPKGYGDASINQFGTNSAGSGKHV